MGRKPVDIDLEELKKTILEVEKDGPLKNRDALHVAVGEKMEPKVSKSVVMLRIRDNNIEVKTPLGKRGRQPGEGGPVNRQPRASKIDAKNVKEIRKELFGIASLSSQPTSTFNVLKKKLDRLENGSMKAAVQLMCITCTQGDKMSIKHCSCLDCPLWSFRPYRTGEQLVETGDEE